MSVIIAQFSWNAKGRRKGDAVPLDPLPKGPVPLESLLALTRGRGLYNSANIQHDRTFPERKATRSGNADY